jgi:hypothetical protein
LQIEKIDLEKQVTRRAAVKKWDEFKKKRLKTESGRVLKAENFIEGNNDFFFRRVTN